MIQQNQNDLWAGVKILIVLGWLFLGVGFQSLPLLFCAYMPNATTAPRGLAKTEPQPLVLKIQKNPSFLF